VVRDGEAGTEKTEEYIIDQNSDKWKKCKFLGSLSDTTTDIVRRKALAINAANNIQKIFINNKLLTITAKMNAFTTYVQPVFLYNSKN